MNCIKCGNQLPEGAGFCTACGAPQTNPPDSPLTLDTQANSAIRPPEIYIQPQPNTPVQPVRPKKKGGFFKVLLVLVLALILVSGVTVLSYFTFLPAKYTLMVAEYSKVLKSYDSFDKNMARYEERVVKPTYENTVQKQAELSFSIEDSLLEQFGLPPETIELVSQGLKNLSLKYGYAIDAKNKKETVNFGINPGLTLDMFIEDTRFGFSMPELSSKTIVGDLKELDKLAEMFPDVDPMMIEAYKNVDPWVSTRVYDEVKIDREDIKKVMLDYSREIIDSIDAGDMSIKRGRKTEVLGKDLSCQEITIKLDQKAQKKILANMLDRLENDMNVYNLTCGNILKLYDILGENEMYRQLFEGIDVEEELSKDNYKDQISALKDELDESEFPEEIEAKIYIKGLDVVKYSFDFTTGTPEEDALVTIEDVTDGLSYHQKYTISGGAEGNSGEIVLSLKKDYDESSDTTDFTAELTADMDMPDDSGKVSFTVTSEEEPSGKNNVDHNVTAAMTVDMVSYGTPTKGDITFTLEGSKTRNSKGLVTTSEYKGDINVNVPDQLPQPVKLGFAVDTETSYGEKVTIPEPDDVLDIATATQEDYDQLMNEINEKVGALFMMFGGY